MRSSAASTTIVKQYQDGTAKVVSLKNIDTIQVKGVRLCNTARGEAADKDRSLSNSVYRTKCRFYDLIHSMNVEWFGSLTFNKNYRHDLDRYDKESIVKYVKGQFCKFKARAPNLQYIYVFEQHEDGAWHVHCVLGNINGLTFIDSKKNIYGRKVYNLADWLAGFSDFTKTDDPQRAATYMLKYVTKKLCQEFNQNRYFASKNIGNPKKDVLQYDDNTFFNSPYTGTLDLKLDPENNIDQFMEDYFGIYKFVHEKKTEIESSYNFNLEIQTNYYKKVEEK